MPIAALSETTSSVICSSLVLNDAVSVVKELIDNALDSKASNVVVEISANTIDIIQVKDNGAGIGVEDRQQLCKRGYTSKIRTLDDLAQLGGTYLGFRGEALASTAELSDSVTFTTRVDGETAATLLKFDSKGKLKSSSSASHGTGTTVRVADFLKAIPVRRETALRRASKVLGKVKKLLFDYAFARPTVRFQLKVLKSKSELKDNWSFAPVNDAGNLSVIASKIVGNELAKRCKEAKVCSDNQSYTVYGLVVSRETDLTKTGGNDRYIAIDGRPVSGVGNFGKEVNKIYKSYLRNVTDDSYRAGTQLLFLRLECPKGSYDVNIEPAKNEVLFDDQEMVLGLFEQLCRSVYGEKATAQLKASDNAGIGSQLPDIGFNALLARRQIAVQDTAHTVVESSASQANGLINRDGPDFSHLSLETGPAKQKPKTHHNMYSIDGSDLKTSDTGAELLSDQGLIEEEEDDIMDVKVTNPFVLAKINTRIKPQDVSGSVYVKLQFAAPSDQEPVQPTTERHSSIPHLTPWVTSAKMLLSAETSPERVQPYQNPGPPNRPWKQRRDREDEMEVPESPPRAGATACQRSRATLLESWTQHINSSPAAHSPESLFEVRKSEPVSQRRLSSKADINNTSNFNLNLKPRNQTAFRTPFKKLSVGQADELEQQQLTSTTRRTLASLFVTQNADVPVTINGAGPQFPTFGRPLSNDTSELDAIMDFEHRKRSTMLQHKNRAKRGQETRDVSRQDDHAAEDELIAPSHVARRDAEPVMDTRYVMKFGKPRNTAEDSDIPPQLNSASYSQNPYWNRYQHAIRDLHERSHQSKQHADEDNTDLPEVAREEMAGLQLTLSPHDPRAYLICQQCDADANSKSANPKRSKTSKLPLETIKTEWATLSVVGTLDNTRTVDIVQLAEITKELDCTDIYVQFGFVADRSDKESLSATAENSMQQWENIVQGLLQQSKALMAS